jgi:hypothetical protein
MRIAVALGLPHTPWIPERVKSFDRLRRTLDASGSAEHGKVFDERESNRVWPGKLWRGGIMTGASHLLQLQDDVIPCEKFWPVYRAMLEAVPDQIIGLEANHPLGPEMYRTGRRWYRTRAWLVGVGYSWPLDPKLPNGLPAFVRWCDANPELVEANNEDSLVNLWAQAHGFDIWHPVPTIIDHDTGVPSTYGNDGHHEWSMHRRPTVTWKDVALTAGLEGRDYWRVQEPPLLPGPGTQRCWFCARRQGHVVSQETGTRICPICAHSIVGAYLPKDPK